MLLSLNRTPFNEYALASGIIGIGQQNCTAEASAEPIRIRLSQARIDQPCLALGDVDGAGTFLAGGRIDAHSAVAVDAVAARSGLVDALLAAQFSAQAHRDAYVQAGINVTADAIPQAAALRPSSGATSPRASGSADNQKWIKATPFSSVAVGAVLEGIPFRQIDGEGAIQCGVSRYFAAANAHVGEAVTGCSAEVEPAPSTRIVSADGESLMQADCLVQGSERQILELHIAASAQVDAEPAVFDADQGLRIVDASADQIATALLSPAPTVVYVISEIIALGAAAEAGGYRSRVGDGHITLSSDCAPASVAVWSPTRSNVDVLISVDLGAQAKRTAQVYSQLSSHSQSQSQVIAIRAAAADLNVVAAPTANGDVYVIAAADQACNANVSAEVVRVVQVAAEISLSPFATGFIQFNDLEPAGINRTLYIGQDRYAVLVEPEAREVVIG